MNSTTAMPMTTLPDPVHHRPDPDYLRFLLQSAGLTQQAAADRIGVSGRIMRQYLADRHALTAVSAPYPVQFALEALARDAQRRARRKGARRVAL